MTVSPVVFDDTDGRIVRFAVAIPAKDEAACLPACLHAFGRQTGIDLGDLAVVVALNNTTDRSLAVSAAVAAQIGCSLVVIDETLELERAHAGWARKLALDEACRRCHPDGLVLTSDADTVVDDDWVASNQAELAAGADIVAGFVTAQPDELQRLDAAILERGALEWQYQNLLAAYEAMIDPLPWDPAPRHNQMCGASLAVRRAAYEAVGGLPPLRVGEDRALCEALLARDYRLRHSLKAHVTTSARTIGRAEGGMADALRLRHDPDYPCDDILETVDRARFRWQTRHRLRASWPDWDIEAIAASIDTAPDIVANARKEPGFGAVWAALEQTCPALAVELVTARSLPAELTRLRALVPDSAEIAG